MLKILKSYYETSLLDGGISSSPILAPTFADCNQIYVLLADDQLHERQSSLPVWPAALITSLTPPVNLACRRNLSKESNPIQQITLSQKSGL